MTNETIFSTSDLALATTISLSFPIKFIDRSNPHRAEFIFDNSYELIKLIESFWKNELRIEPKQFYQQQRIIKARLYDKR